MGETRPRSGFERRSASDPELTPSNRDASAHPYVTRPLLTPVKEGHHDSHINHQRGGRYTMNAPASITITPVRVADLLAEGERMPVYVHVIDHPDARVLVDTGMTELHPAVADLIPASVH